MTFINLMSVAFAVLTPPVQDQGRADVDWFGRSVCSIQDVDGDGRDDLIVGDASFEHRGAVWTVNGKDGHRIAQALGDSESAWLGDALLTIPDEDDDGVREVIAPLGFPDATALRVLSGKTLRTLRTSERIAIGKGVEFLWEAIGDLDADGREDLALSVDGDSTSAVDVFSTKSNGRILHVAAPVSRWRRGSHVARMGDFDGDGVPDLGVSSGSCAHAAERHRLFVFSGKSGARVGEIASGAPAAGFALAFGIVPDLDGDTVEEILLVDDASGWTSVWSGKTRERLRTLEGHWSDDFLGSAEFGGVSRLRDLNGDGVADFAIAVDSFMEPRVRVYSGKDGSLIRVHAAPKRPGSTFRFAACVADAGDLDGDRSGDYAVGASHGVGDFAQGYVVAYSGATGQTMFTIDVARLTAK